MKIGPSLDTLAVGDAVCIIRALKIGDTSARSHLNYLIASYASRRGIFVRYETFTALTSRMRPIVGCIVTRVAERTATGGKPPG
jgi:hypothetical protein